MSTKTKILEPPKQKTEVQQPAATTQVQAPAVEIEKKETEAVAPTNVVSDATEAMKTVSPMENTTSFMPKEIAQRSNTPTDEEVAKRNMEVFREWYEKQDGLTDEERAKRDKARAAKSIFATIGDGLASIANLHSTINYAPNMDLTSGMERLRARWDKEDAEGRAKAREALSLYQQMKAAQRAEDEIKHRNQREEKADKIAEEERKYRREQAAKAEAARAAAALQAQTNADRDFEYKKEYNAAKLAQEAAQFNTREARLANQNGGAGGDKNAVKWILGDDETVYIPKASLDSEENLSAIFHSLPAEIQEQAKAEFGFEDGMDYVTGKKKYKPLTNAQMSNAVGKYISHPDSEKARNHARKLANKATKQTRDWSKYEQNSANDSDDLDSFFID